MSHKPPTGDATGISVLDLPDHSSVAFDAEAFSEAIEAHGVDLVHERGMADPVGLVEVHDVRRPGAPASRSSGGRIYTPAGCLRGIVTGNSKDLRGSEQGLVDASTASLTPALTYEDGKPVYMHVGDRLFLKECAIRVPHQQLVKAHPSGRDRLRYPAVEVQDLVDSAEVRFEPGADFDLVNGQLVWRDGRRPAAVYAVRFLYRPHWYVDRFMHEIRVAQTVDMDGQRRQIRMPQAAVIRREYAYHNEAQDPLGTGAQPRAGEAPADGAFAPR